MDEQLTVTEQFSAVWKTSAYGTAVLAIIFFIVFLLTTDPLLIGIFRFIAFIAFIGAVFSFLRLREGQKKVQINFLEKQLLITYLKKDKIVKEEAFEKKTVKKVYEKEIKSLGGLPFLEKSYVFFITFTDTDNKIPMFEYSGRNLHFSNKTTTKIDRFINEQLNVNTNPADEH